nr:ribonuclease H-like domain-containing protein [Tanacetum cinerariifolium]
MHKAFPLLAIKFPLPEELPTASENGSHCQKKRDATARKIVMLSMRITFNTHLTFTFNSKQDMDQQYLIIAKIPVLDTRKFEQWQFWIQQYLQHEHYALWEVIEFGDSYEVPVNDPSTTTINTTSGEAGTKSGRTVTLTTEDMQKKKNDVKARTTLLLSLPDEHQLQFSKYKTAREVWAAILKTFGGNEATKKTKKNLLKQQYGNFRAEGSETLEQMFTRLQVIIEVHKKTEPNTQNMAFISSAKHNKGNNEVNTASVYTASSNVPTASANVTTIDEDDIEEMDIKWNMALLSMRGDKFWKKTWKKISIQGSNVAGFDKSKVKYFNCHKMGHFVRKCRAPRNQDRGRRDNYRHGFKSEERAPKALMSIDGVGWDWSYMANDEEDHALVADEEAPTEFALMANTSTKSKVFDNSLCSKDCKKNNDSLNSKITNLIDKLFDAKNMIYHYKELETLKQEKEVVDGKLAGLLTATKDLDNLIESQRSDKSKEECIVLGRDFKLLDDANVLLRTPRQHNMYSIDLNNIVPHKDLTCLVAKASADECMIWHRRLGKFEAKGDEGYFLGYSMSSKAFRVFNKRTKRVEENLHIELLENKAIEKGSGPNWLFDIDSLTKSMNYVPVVVAGTNSTNFSGTKVDARQDVKKDMSFLRYIVLPNWVHEEHLKSPSSQPQDACNTDAPKSSRNSNPTATSTNPSAD